MWPCCRTAPWSPGVRITSHETPWSFLYPCTVVAHSLVHAVFFIIILGFGNSGELARSADMINRNEKGEFDLKKPHVNKDGTFDYPFICEKFLRPGPVRFAVGSQKKTVLTVACGSMHLLVVAREPNQFQSTLYSSGRNQYGQLGHGDEIIRHELTPVRFLF
jgi:Regulator of chromosome condensation (RCC1) repeat